MLCRYYFFHMSAYVCNVCIAYIHVDNFATLAQFGTVCVILTTEGYSNHNNTYFIFFHAESLNTDDSISIIMSHNSILVTVTRYQAEEINKIHQLYGYYHLGLSKRSLSLIYRKSIETIEYWISRWDVFKSA